VLRSPMHVVAGILDVFAASLEITGVLLVVRFASKVRRTLRTGALGRIDGCDASGRTSQPDSIDLVALLTDNAAHPWLASTLLAVGILAGTVASLLTL
jgi:hypothetical protein